MKGFYPEGWQSSDKDAKKVNYSLTQLKEASLSGEILEAVAYMCDSDHNLLVNLGSISGVIPRVEGAIGIEEGKTRDIALISRVGKPVCFTVEEIFETENKKPCALLSRRNAQRQCKREFLNRLSPGDIINAKITHLENFGAFCDIGCGNIALLPIDAISVSRISHPADRFKNGDNIKVIVKNIDEVGRITLTHKELLGTWQENADRISQGQTVSGIVRSIETYGIFIELAPNLAGLAEPKEGVRVGQTAGVYIKSIIPEKMKVKLIIIDSFDSLDILPFEYFYEGDRMEHFVYSPKESQKLIETIF
ncbi:MAG: S1 RNA-binding domain-containing protein [Ruminococcaceae bacterium]|nr:S1 RNA-binding domain-containing protein [Oscillospiraceae bacterium]